MRKFVIAAKQQTDCQFLKRFRFLRKLLRLLFPHKQSLHAEHLSNFDSQQPFSYSAAELSVVGLFTLQARIAPWRHNQRCRLLSATFANDSQVTMELDVKLAIISSKNGEQEPNEFQTCPSTVR